MHYYNPDGWIYIPPLSPLVTISFIVSLLYLILSFGFNTVLPTIDTDMDMGRCAVTQLCAFQPVRSIIESYVISLKPGPSTEGLVRIPAQVQTQWDCMFNKLYVRTGGKSSFNNLSEKNKLKKATNHTTFVL